MLSLMLFFCQHVANTTFDAHDRLLACKMLTKFLEQLLQKKYIELGDETWVEVSHIWMIKVFSEILVLLLW